MVSGAFGLGLGLSVCEASEAAGLKTLSVLFSFSFLVDGGAKRLRTFEIHGPVQVVWYWYAGLSTGKAHGWKSVQDWGHWAK